MNKIKLKIIIKVPLKHWKNQYLKEWKLILYNKKIKWKIKDYPKSSSNQSDT